MVALQQPRWISRIVLFVGLVSLAGALAPDIRSHTHRIESLLPSAFPAAATMGAAAIGAILIVLARGLRRGKYRAWLLALVLTSLDAALLIVHGLRIGPAVVCLLFALLLARARRNFTARPDPRSLTRVAQTLVIGPVVAVALGYVWQVVDRDGQVPGTTTGARLLASALGLVGISGPVTYTDDGAATRAAVGFAVLGAAVLVLTILAALQPAGGPHPLTPDEDERIRGLLERDGHLDSLSYFATRRDRTVIFSADQRAAVTYGVIGTTSLAVGDPIGNPAAWPDAIRAWLDEARSFGWTPAVLGASEKGAAIYHRAGLEVLELGDEAILHVADWSLEGRSMRGVRQAVARTTRAGVTARVARFRDLDADLADVLVRRAEEWREGDVEQGFSMALGRFGDPLDDTTVVYAVDATGEPVGLLHFVPWGRDSLSLDLMRRSRDSENGVIELLVTKLMEQAPELGITRVSLNFAVFRGVFARGERLGAGPVLKLWRATLLFVSRFYQLESLYRANAKYQPEWVPRYVAYVGPTDIPRVGTAILRAESLLVLPWPLSRFNRSGPVVGDDASGWAADAT